jgi:hypothetical protein
MVLLKIQGFDVDFPFRPYPAQLAFMASMLRALQAKEVTFLLLFSPTLSHSQMSVCDGMAWSCVLG